eukprot:517715-Rhodomonas_salina.1
MVTQVLEPEAAAFSARKNRLRCPSLLCSQTPRCHVCDMLRTIFQTPVHTHTHTHRQSTLIKLPLGRDARVKGRGKRGEDGSRRVDGVQGSSGSPWMPEP